MSQNGPSPVVRIRTSPIIQVPVRITGSRSVMDTMVFDTGSHHTWMYHYQILNQIPCMRGRGYSDSRVRTRLSIPHGAHVLEYVDKDAVRTDVWTKRDFTVGDNTWSQIFGIVVEAKLHTPPSFSGLLAASRSSSFVKINPVFSFVPVVSNPKTMTMEFNRVNASVHCLSSEMEYFTMNNAGSMHGFWNSEVQVSWGPLRAHAVVVFDTGASVLALPATLFDTALRQLIARGVQAVYIPERMHIIVGCDSVHNIPHFRVYSNPSAKPIVITADMMLTRTLGTTCRLLIARIGDHQPVILGLPLLRFVVSEFDSENDRVGICRPQQSFITDYDSDAFTADEENAATVSSFSKASANQIKHPVIRTIGALLSVLIAIIL